MTSSSACVTRSACSGSTYCVVEQARGGCTRWIFSCGQKNEREYESNEPGASWAHLHSLAVRPVNVDAHHRAAPLRVGRLGKVVVQVLLVPHRVQPLEHKLEQRAQILGRRAGHKNVGVPQPQRPSDRKAQRRRLSAAAARRERHGRAQRLFAGGVQKSHHSATLVQSAAQAQQAAHGLRVGQGLGQLPQPLRRRLCRPRGGATLTSSGAGRGERAHVGRDGQQVELVVHEDARGARREAEREALVEAARHRAVSLCAEPGVHVHDLQSKVAIEGRRPAHEANEVFSR